MNRRDFTKYFIAAAAVFLPNHSVVGALRHRYQLASESILPEGLRAAPDEIREAYRFAVANRDVLRYIPCYCGCGEQGIPAMPLATLKTAHRWTSQNSTR